MLIKTQWNDVDEKCAWMKATAVDTAGEKNIFFKLKVVLTFFPIFFPIALDTYVDI